MAAAKLFASSFAAIITNIGILGVTSHTLGSVYSLRSTERVALCIVLEHVLLVWKFVVQVRVADAPLWVRKARAYQRWLHERGQEDMQPSLRDAALLQAQFDAEDDAEVTWL